MTQVNGPRTFAERLRRLRVIAADKAFPGGLVAHLPPEPEPAVAEPQPVLIDAAVVEHIKDRTLPVRSYVLGQGSLATELAACFTDADRAALDPVLTDEEREILALNEEPSRTFLSIGLSLAHGLPGFAERTGLSASVPPESIHSMTRGSWGTGGDPWYADGIDAALRDAGANLGEGSRVLDYGCSSGRVVRMLAARRPEVRWEGCDVNAEAIAWASEAIPGVTFRNQPLRPPLPYPDGHFDAAYAISIWSHYAEEPALAWLEEMRRIIRPGGHLLLSTHGPNAIAVRAALPDHGVAGQAPILAGLYHDGFVFVDVFGDQGDWGVVDSGWGMSFFTPEWLAGHLTPEWSIALFRVGGIEGHQDLYVLRRER